MNLVSIWPYLSLRAEYLKKQLMFLNMDKPYPLLDIEYLKKQLIFDNKVSL